MASGRRDLEGPPPAAKPLERPAGPGDPAAGQQAGRHLGGEEKRADHVVMTRTPLRDPTILRRALDLAHDVQWWIGGLRKGPSAGMRTNATVGEKPVLFIHNPRTAGRSLEAMLEVRRLSHRYPSEKLTEAQWLSSYIVSAVRHPLDRFYSHYIKVVKSRRVNRLVKLHGEGVYDLTAMEFLDLIRKHPRYGGSQRQWTDYPSAAKPRADLVLRFEEIGRWPEILTEAGVLGQAESIPRIGKASSGRKEELLAMSQAEMDEVRAAVEAQYAGDYETFGYARRDARI